MAVAACSGSDGISGGTTTPAPAPAPTVTISASSARAESGAQIGLTASARSSAGDTLSTTITCSAGSVSGTVFTAPTVSTATDVTCTAQATDSAGTVGRATVSIAIAPPSTEKLALSSDSVSLTPGEVGGLTLTAIPLTKDDYDGRVGGVTVELRRVDPTTLAFALPTGLAAGTFSLSVDIEGKTYVATGTVKAKPVITDPKGDVLTAARSAEASLVATLDGLPSSASSLERGQYTQALTNVRQAIAQIDTLSTADLQTMAEVLAANNVSPARGLAANTTDSDECASARQAYKDTDARLAKKQKIMLLATAGIIYTGFGTGGLRIIIGGVALGITISEIKKDVATLLGLGGTVVAKCVAAIDDELIALITSQGSNVRAPLSLVSAATAARVGFSSGVARDFTIRRTYDVLPAFAAALKPEFLAAQQRIASFTFLPDSLRAAIAALQLTRTEVVDPARIAVSAPSNPRVTGGASANGSALRMTYRLATGAAASEDFQVTLSDPSVNLSTVVLASVSAGIPTAAGATVRVQQDQPVTIPVQTEYATSLEVATQPTNGTVTVNGVAGFVYRPRTGFFGNDSFTYVAVNAAGRSQPATVSISVQRDYAGLWNISYRSTITSGGNVCGAESFNGQVTVVRQSDLIYSFTIVGNTVTLRQNSVNDPAGLSSSGTLTYPEDNGTTVSNITVTVPTATSLSGTSSWRWSNASNQSCTGTGSFTGIR